MGSSRTNLTAGRRNPSKTSSKRSLRDQAMSLLRAEQSRSGGQEEEPVPTPEKKIKSSRLLAIISCCSVASRDKDDARPAVKTAQNRQPAKVSQPVIEKTDSGPAESSTVEPRDSECTDEKPRLDGDVTAKPRAEEATVSEERITETTTETDPVSSTVVDTSTAEEPKQGPAVERELERRKDDHDTAMADVDDAPQEDQAPGKHPSSEIVPAQPPPPPTDTTVSGSQTPERSGQTALLPPALPHLKNRKCLVLDLDETLVHSSFKVCGLRVVHTNTITDAAL